MRYTKTPLSTKQHLDLLSERGLSICDEDRATKYLENVGYFRLTGYMFHLQKRDGSHEFESGIDFNDIINLYKFDKTLRSILLEYLERIEVKLRASLTNIYCAKYGFFWQLQDDLYEDDGIFLLINEEIKKVFSDASTQEAYVKKFKIKYEEESSPPCNMALELLSFGKLSKLYEGLSKKQPEHLQVAKEFGTIGKFLISWLRSLTIVRNRCAHHSRVWNKDFSVNQSALPSKSNLKFYKQDDLPDDFTKTMYGVISFMAKLLISFNPNNSFTSKVEQLIATHKIDTTLMGFPDDWQVNAPWKHL